jgi:hypothetical protein
MVVVGGIFLFVIAVAMLRWTIAPARAIWRGDADGVPFLHNIQPTTRTYFAYLLWIVPVNAGMALLGLVGVLGSLMGDDREVLRPVFVTSVALVLGSLPLVLVHMAVALVGRPRFLIAPPYRHEPPLLSQWLSRWLHRGGGRRGPGSRPPRRRPAGRG